MGDNIDQDWGSLNVYENLVVFSSWFLMKVYINCLGRPHIWENF